MGETPRLFSPEELRLRRSGTARLRRLTRLPPRDPTVRERRHDEDREMMVKLQDWGRELAGRFRLRYRALEPERDGVVEHYGICYEDGVIRIRLRHAKTGRLLKESSLVDTLCHELAHLRHFDHSIRFQRFYRRILEEARSRGYYRPGPQREPSRQLPLFDPADCGVPS